MGVRWTDSMPNPARLCLVRIAYTRRLTWAVAAAAALALTALGTSARHSCNSSTVPNIHMRSPDGSLSNDANVDTGNPIPVVRDASSTTMTGSVTADAEPEPRPSSIEERIQGCEGLPDRDHVARYEPVGEDAVHAV